MKKGTDEKQEEKVKSPDDCCKTEKEKKEISGTQEKEIDVLREQIKKLESEKDEMKDQYIRKYADFENFRKRLMRDKEEAVKYANSTLLNDLIGILDDFERAVSSVKNANDFDTLVNGIKLIEKQMSGLLEKKWGLKKYVPLNEPFDPEKHEALMMVESPDVTKATVIEVFQNGYILNDRIIRHAKVKVCMPGKKEAVNSDAASENK